MTYHIARSRKDYHKDYYFVIGDGHIVVQENRPGAEKKSMKIESCSDYVFKAMKTKIKAINGAAGLEKFLSENLKITDLFGCRAWNLIEHINPYGK